MPALESLNRSRMGLPKTKEPREEVNIVNLDKGFILGSDP
jgi:hypothetical protein